MTDPAIPAATLVILRERASGPPEVLMVERAATMAFAGGATVFPGGRVDPGDRVLAAALAPADAEDAAARIAAIRETLEEAGLAIGFAAVPDPATVAAMRAALATGEAFAGVLARHGQRLVPERLVAFARWRPDHPGMRIFDTRFYLAVLPAGGPRGEADGGESVRLGWDSAAGWLAAAERGEVQLIYPTRRNLERLARFASPDDAEADAAAHPVRTVTPWTELRDGVPHLCIPDDLGYPVTAEPLAGAARE